jgi:CDP-6-deoxy-D-xylo-4-hexulose-3-dehydrase
MSLIKLENEILSLVKKFYFLKNLNNKIEPGKDTIPVSGKSYNEDEVINLTKSALDFWLTSGRFNKEFESKLSKFLGIKYVLTTNSGSSANLLAVSALTSSKLNEKRLLPGDEVITVAAGFPTTVNPIIQNNLKPVFVDIDIGTYNVNIDDLKSAISNKTKAIVLAHTLGNPYNLDEISKICKENNLFLIEDSADALGAKFNGKIVN